MLHRRRPRPCRRARMRIARSRTVRATLAQPARGGAALGCRISCYHGDRELLSLGDVSKRDGVDDYSATKGVVSRLTAARRRRCRVALGGSG